MKNAVATIIALLGVCAWASEALADSLSLEQATQQAETNSPDLKGLRASAEKTSWDKNSAMAGYLPHLSLGYSHYFNSNYLTETVNFNGNPLSFPAAFPQDNFAVDAVWTIFDGFQGYYNYKAASLHTEAADLQVKQAQFKLERSVRIAFYQALSAQKLSEVAHQNIKTLEDHLLRVNQTTRAGYGTRFDVLRIDATLEEAKANGEEADSNVQIARQALYQAMGLDKDDGRPLLGELPVLKENLVSENLIYSSADRQDIQALEKLQDSSAALRSASKSYWYPSVSLIAEQQYYEFGSFTPAVLPNSTYQNASYFGVQLKWNIFDGGLSYAKQKQAVQAEIESQSQTDKAKLAMSTDVQTWMKKFKYSVSLYKARLRALDEFQESVRLAEIGVKAGNRTHTEMLDAELDLFRARGSLVRAQTDAIEAISQLELAIGRNLWNPSSI